MRFVVDSQSVFGARSGGTRHEPSPLSQSAAVREDHTPRQAGKPRTVRHHTVAHTRVQAGGSTADRTAVRARCVAQSRVGCAVRRPVLLPPRVGGTFSSRPHLFRFSRSPRLSRRLCSCVRSASLCSVDVASSSRPVRPAPPGPLRVRPLAAHVRHRLRSVGRSADPSLVPSPLPLALLRAPDACRCGSIERRDAEQTVTPVPVGESAPLLSLALSLELSCSPERTRRRLGSGSYQWRRLEKILKEIE